MNGGLNPASLNKKRSQLAIDVDKTTADYKRISSALNQVSGHEEYKVARAQMTTAARKMNEAKNKLRRFNKANPA